MSVQLYNGGRMDLHLNLPELPLVTEFERERDAASLGLELRDSSLCEDPGPDLRNLLIANPLGTD